MTARGATFSCRPIKILTILFSHTLPRCLHQVDANFDVHNIPYDVLWLDIEHTDGKRYLTWDANKFPDSVAMINAVAAKGAPPFVLRARLAAPPSGTSLVCGWQRP